MRRRCVYTACRRDPKTSAMVEVGEQCEGWLIGVVGIGNALNFVIEGADGCIDRVHEAYISLRLVPEDTPFPGDEKSDE